MKRGDEVGGEQLDGCVHEHATVLAGGELAAVVGQVVEPLDVVDQLPWFTGTHDGDGEVDAVERDVVLAEELHVAHVGGLVPP